MESLTLSFWLIITFILLVGFSSLTALTNALRRIHKKDTKKHWKSLEGAFFYRSLHQLFFPKQSLKGLFFACFAAQSWIRVAYGASLGLFALYLVRDFPRPIPLLSEFLLIGSLLFISYFLGDFLPKTVGIRHPERVVQAVGFVASLFLTLTFPFLLLFLLLFGRLQSIQGALQERETLEGGGHEALPDILDDAGVGEILKADEKKIFQSIVSFRDRVAREVMVPRIDIFCLPASTSIRQAVPLLLKEGYSRTPVYRHTIDEIVGILMYKDILTQFMEATSSKNESILDAPIEGILKPVLYAPETKKISLLLQEFRKKQMHLAIVVDEYGGTEGVVTIEDILEEIVGEIEDEYDEESSLFMKAPDGSWIIDAKMNIYDLKERLGFEITESSDYDTVGGYLFALTASIPPKGYRVLLDDCSLEVLSSSERNIGKIRIQRRD